MRADKKMYIHYAIETRDLPMAKLPIPGENITSQALYILQPWLVYFHVHFNYPVFSGLLYVL